MEEKYKEFLNEIGFSEEIKDDTDVKALAVSFKEKQAELHKNNPAVMDEEKAKAKKEGAIVAEKRFKKLANSQFGLGLTDSALNDISSEDLLVKVKDTTKQEVGKDVEELQKKIVEITNEKTAEIDKLKAEKEQEKAEFEGKWKAQIRNKVLSNKFNEKEYIGTKDKLFDYFLKSLTADGYDIQVDDDGNVTKIMKGGYEALKPDNTAKETIDSLHERYMNEFIKKSNGADGEQRQKPAGDIDESKLPPAMQQRLKEMKEKEAKQIAA